MTVKLVQTTFACCSHKHAVSPRSQQPQTFAKCFQEVDEGKVPQLSVTVVVLTHDTNNSLLVF